jgi:hypothetical protein
VHATLFIDTLRLLVDQLLLAIQRNDDDPGSIDADALSQRGISDESACAVIPFDPSISLLIQLGIG